MDADVQLSFVSLEVRILTNMQAKSGYGDAEIIGNQRVRIVKKLNGFALTHLGRSVNELCRMWSSHVLFNIFQTGCASGTELLENTAILRTKEDEPAAHRE